MRKMIAWIKNISAGKLILTGVVYTIIATVIHQAEALLTMGYYLKPEFFGLWSRLMMPRQGPPPSSFFITSAVFTFITGVSLGLVYYYIKEMLPKDFKKRVFLFADLMIGASFIFFTLPVYLLFNVPLGLLISWFVSSFAILISISYFFVKYLK